MYVYLPGFWQGDVPTRQGTQGKRKLAGMGEDYFNFRFIRFDVLVRYLGG